MSTGPKLIKEYTEVPMEYPAKPTNNNKGSHMLELLLVETVETNKDGSNTDQEEANRDDEDDQFS